VEVDEVVWCSGISQSSFCVSIVYVAVYTMANIAIQK